MQKKNRVQLLLPFVFIACGIFLYFYLMWGNVTNFVHKVDPCEVLFCDFVLHYHPTAQTIFETKLPLYGFIYSPFFAMFTSGFGRFPIESATIVWGGFELLFTLLLFLIPYRQLTKGIAKMQYFYFILFFTSLPVIHNFKWGQVSVIIVATTIAAFSAHKAGRSVLAGILLGISASIKYYPAIFFLYFLLKRDRVATIFFIFTCISLLIFLPVIFLGVGGWIGFLAATFEKLSVIGDTASNPNTQYFPYVFMRLFEISTARVFVAQILRIAGMAIALFNFMLLWVMNKKNIEANSILSISLLFCTLPFLVETSWHHYFIFLPFVQLSLFWTTRSRWIKSFIILSMGLSSIFIVNLFQTWNDYTKWGFSFLSTSLILVSIYLIILETYRKQKGIVQ